MIYRKWEKKVLKKGVLRNFAKSTGKHICQGLFFNKVAGLCLFFNKIAGLRPATLVEKELGTGVFLWVLRNF